MSGAAVTPGDKVVIPEFKQIMGHPAPLWMLFMTEFWERFAFYGIRWALVLYIVAQFYGGAAVGQADANLTYGSYLALVYAGAVFGGLIADRVIGYQRSILIGAVFMAAGLFMITLPNPDIFKLGLATIIVGNGMFKPNISTMVGKLYALNDTRRDSGFTIFYMGINAGAFIAPILTQILAQKLGDGTTPAYKVVFFAAGVGMLVSLVWFYIGRKTLAGIGAPERAGTGPRPLGRRHHRQRHRDPGRLLPAETRRQHPAGHPDRSCSSRLALMLMIEGIRNGKVARDKTIAMMIIFVFNILFWMLLRAGRQLVHLPGRPDRRPQPLRLDLPGRLVPERELDRHHRVRPDHRRHLGDAGPPQREPVDPAQVRPRPDLQRPGLRPADVRAVDPGRHERQDPVLDPVHGLLHPVGR